MASHLPPNVQEEIAELTKSNSLWDSAMIFLTKRGH
jgi:tryptophan 2,3-dioxygenase